LIAQSGVEIFAKRKTLHKSDNRERDYSLLLLMFRHGLRVSEACQLKVTDVNLKEKIIHIHRLKNGNPTTQPMYNGEVAL
jgi:type 1 fimbriae regulatory protein FimB